MKKILLIMLVMLPMMLFSSCSKDDEDEKTRIDPELVGSWEAIDASGKVVVTFDSNGSFKIEIYIPESDKYKLISSETDTYTMDGKRIIFKKGPIGHYALKDNILTLTIDNQTIICKKVK